MSEAPSVLVVDDSAAQGEIVSTLRDAGYQATGVGTFEEATDLIATNPPDALITELRLGAYNGLHLVIRSQASRPDIVAIIHTAFPDPVLEAEAHRVEADFLVRPVDTPTLLGLLTNRLGTPTDRRSAPRKRVEGGIAVRIAGTAASLVDLSYGGFKAQLSSDEIPSPFEVRLPNSDVSIKARVIWAHRQTTSDGSLLCGASVSDLDATAEPAWRQIVDSA